MRYNYIGEDIENKQAAWNSNSFIKQGNYYGERTGRKVRSFNENYLPGY